MNKVIGGLTAYSTLRHILPAQPVSIKETIAHSHVNCILFDTVEKWYDFECGCSGLTSFYWRRVIPIRAIIKDE